jgi:toxin secretion/phage lysis holin
MKVIWNWIQTVIVAAGAFMGWFLGGLDGLLYALIAFAVIDYITGVLCAIIDKKLCSKIGAKGIFKKILIFALVGLGHILDAYVLNFAGNSDGSVIRTAVIFFYLSNEGISILENAAHIGLPIPEKLKDVLKQLHGRDDNEPPSPQDKV